MSTSKTKKTSQSDRAIILYRDGLSLRQIAELLGCSHQTVKNLLERRRVKRRPVGRQREWQ